MTRKDYILIAKVINAQYRSSLTHVDKDTAEAEAYSVRCVADHLALEFELDNPNFDKIRFIKACGLL